MSDNEYEAFEITDYDLENEFNINRPRRTSKNQQIYGIWAKDEDSDDDGTGRPSFKSGGRKSKNYTAPIGFIAGGIQQAGKPKENEKEEEEDDEDAKSQLQGSSSSDDEPKMASFQGDVLAGITDEIAGLRKKQKSKKYNPVVSQLERRGVGTWEKHTKGIGAKLLLQMGYQPGKGLGKDLQGIEAPIEAKLRKGRGAIGAYGPEKKQKPLETKPELKSDAKDVGGDKVSQWRKSEGSKSKKARYVYKSIEDVLDQKQPLRRREFNELSKVKVIDMTGPEQRVLSGYHAISGTQKPSDQWEIRKEKTFTNFQLPELQHNLNLLVDMCEQDIISNDRAIRYKEDRIVALENEVKGMEKLTLQEGAIIEGLEQVLDILERLNSPAPDMTLDQMAAAYEELQENHLTEYILYDLASLAPSLVRPLLKAHLASWDPLEDPLGPLPLLQRWQGLLDKGTSAGPLASPTLLHPYHRLLWDAWMPCIRIAVNAWTVKRPERMLGVVEAWQSLVPPWVLDNILQQLVMPRIQHTAEEWNPLTDTIPVHTWIHPWLPTLGKRLRVSVFPVIRQKLSVALTSWHPSDSSARLMIQPWMSVFTPQELDNFLLANIVPKLGLVLQELVINPAHQTLDGWNWTLDWAEVISPRILAELLDKSFFPKWLQVLSMWLNMAPNYDQVTEWYSHWKSLIPPTLRDQPQVKEHLRTALDLMSRSVGGTPAPPVQAPPPPIIHTDLRYQSMNQGGGSVKDRIRAAASGSSVEGFKELLQKRCEQRGVIFMPLPNRYKDGKQMYRCGVVQIYIDRNVIFYLDNAGNWIPIGLANLIEKAAGNETKYK